MSNVILINPFEVPGDVPDERFLDGWDQAADFLRTRPGFAGARLHRALSPDARFRFVNLAEWESPDHFRAAVTDPAFMALASEAPPNYPALYQIAKTI